MLPVTRLRGGMQRGWTKASPQFSVCCHALNWFCKVFKKLPSEQGGWGMCYRPVPSAVPTSLAFPVGGWAAFAKHRFERLRIEEQPALNMRFGNRADDQTRVT